MTENQNGGNQLRHFFRTFSYKPKLNQAQKWLPDEKEQ